jgi:hypothetical protein
MYPLLTDAQFQSLSLVVVAMIGIIPATLAAVWARNAKANSAEAKSNSADALHEVKANGGMEDPDPTLKDYIKFVGENTMSNTDRLSKLEEVLEAHLAHSKIMDSALAQVFLTIRPDLDRDDLDDLKDNLS